MPVGPVHDNNLGWWNVNKHVSWHSVRLMKCFPQAEHWYKVEVAPCMQSNDPDNYHTGDTLSKNIGVYRASHSLWRPRGTIKIEGLYILSISMNLHVNTVNKTQKYILVYNKTKQSTGKAKKKKIYCTILLNRTYEETAYSPHLDGVSNGIKLV